MPALDPLLPIAAVLDPIFDPLAIRASRALQRLWVGPPFRGDQAEARERALAEVIARRVPSVEALGPAVRRRDPQACARYDAIVAEAVAELRGAAEARAVRTTVQRVAHVVDRALYADAPEWLDDPAFDETLRLRTLDRLDRLNEAIGSYDAFFAAIEPLLSRARAAGVERPTIVDLASGHAMFAVALALRFGAREGKVRVVATDLAPEYLEIGRAHARKLAMDDDAIAFLPQNALDLHDLPGKVGSAIDVVCCTQTIHHFPPGMVARMLAEAAAVARHGVALVDGERNAFALLLIATVGSAIGRGSVPFLHDSIASIRRMYTEQELALLGALSPRGESEQPLELERGWAHPGHVWLRAEAG